MGPVAAVVRGLAVANPGGTPPEGGAAKALRDGRRLLHALGAWPWAGEPQGELRTNGGRILGLRKRGTPAVRSPSALDDHWEQVADQEMGINGGCSLPAFARIS
jgi:hypothetical protein